MSLLRLHLSKRPLCRYPTKPAAVRRHKKKEKRKGKKGNRTRKSKKKIERKKKKKQEKRKKEGRKRKKGKKGNWIFPVATEMYPDTQYKQTQPSQLRSGEAGWILPHHPTPSDPGTHYDASTKPLQRKQKSICINLLLAVESKLHAQSKVVKSTPAQEVFAFGQNPHHQSSPGGSSSSISLMRLTLISVVSFPRRTSLVKCASTCI